jgi:hyperosmotically inducible protein
MARHRFAGMSRLGLWLSLTTVAANPSLLAQQPAPDNTRVNKRDRAAAQPTADQQQNNRSDVTITRDIRRAIVADKRLSTYAHNVKIITQQGEVTLKGPVRSDEEKRAVEAKATDIAGAGHVKSEVSVANAPTKRRAKGKA